MHPRTQVVSHLQVAKVALRLDQPKSALETYQKVQRLGSIEPAVWDSVEPRLGSDMARTFLITWSLDWALMAPPPILGSLLCQLGVDRRARSAHTTHR